MVRRQLLVTNLPSSRGKACCVVCADFLAEHQNKRFAVGQVAPAAVAEPLREADVLPGRGVDEIHAVIRHYAALLFLCTSLTCVTPPLYLPHLADTRWRSTRPILTSLDSAIENLGRSCSPRSSES